MLDVLIKMSALTTVAGLQLPALMATHPQPLLAQCTASLRCAPICAQINDDDEDDMNDDMLDAQRRHFELNGEPDYGESEECVVSVSGSSCFLSKFDDDLLQQPVDESPATDEPSPEMPPSGQDDAPIPRRPYRPIDDERRSRSPGIANNFWDMPQADFKKPWTGARAEPPETPPSSVPIPRRPNQPIDDERRRRSPGIANNFWDMPQKDFKKPWTGARAEPPEAPPSDMDTPISRGPAFPPIDDERRRRSPGIANNFWDMPQADFKRPYGTPPPQDGSAPPPEPPSSPMHPERARLLRSITSAFVLIFNPEQPDEGVYTHDNAVVAFESEEDASRFARRLVKEGFDMSTPTIWSASKLAQFCDFGSFDVSLQRRSSNVEVGGTDKPDPLASERMRLDALLQMDDCGDDDCMLPPGPDDDAE